MSAGGERGASTRRLWIVMLSAVVVVVGMIVATLRGAPWWVFAAISAAAFLAGTFESGRLGLSPMVPRLMRRPIISEPRPGDVLLPLELPVAPSPFVGRDSEIAQMSTYLQSRTKGPYVIVISGPAGIGKTALAMQFAQLSAGRFPDGQLFADLASVPDYDVGLSSLQASFIEALQGQDDPIPSAGNEQVSRYLELTRDRRLLIVIDNFRNDEAYLRPLLPASNSSALIVTSPAPIVLLEDQLDIELKPLGEGVALSLLRAMLGAQRVDADISAAKQIVKNAAGYPLALRLAAASLATRQYWGLGRAVSRMSQEEQRPDHTGSESAFDGLLDISYSMLTEDERRALRLLGLLEEPVFEPWMLAALTGIDDSAALRLAESLVQQRMIERTSEDSDEAQRFRIHEPVFAYGRARLRFETTIEDKRVSMESLAQARQKRQDREPTKQLRKQVFSWQDQGKLAAAVNAARDILALAEGKGDKPAQGMARSALAELYLELGSIDDARDLATAALHGPGPASHPRALRCLGKVEGRLRHIANATCLLDQACNLARELGDKSEEIRVLRELAAAEALGDDPGAGLTTAENAVDLCMRRRDRGQRLLAGVLWSKGTVLLHTGGLGDAAGVLSDAEAVSREADQALWTAWIIHARARAALSAGKHEESEKLAASALTMFRDMRHRYGVAHCRLLLGDVYRAEGRLENAVRLREEALETFQNCGDPWIEAYTSYRLAFDNLDKGNTDDAIELLNSAYQGFAKVGDGESSRQARRDLDSSALRLRRLARLGERLTDAVTPSP
jgi:tetratricopeptide (TPR) repeat protein